MTTLRTPQYWLAQIDDHGDARLINGPYNTADEVNGKPQVIVEIGLKFNPPARFAVARVELSEWQTVRRGYRYRN